MRPNLKKKIEKVNELAEKLKNYKVIAIINLEGLRSRQLQKLRRDLKDVLTLEVTTKNNIIRALKKSGIKGLDKLAEHIRGVCGLAFTNENPFKLSFKLMKMTTPAPAKPGQIAPSDIIVNKGPTPFVPGPIISDLSELGIKTKVEGGKLAIIDDVVLVKAGEVINEKQANILSRLGMMPMRTGLNLIAAYEDGNVYSASDLTIDLDDYKDKMQKAYIDAYNLAFNARIPISEVINLLLITAHAHARNLSINTGYITRDNSSELLIIANAKAHALANKIGWEVR